MSIRSHTHHPGKKRQYLPRTQAPLVFIFRPTPPPTHTPTSPFPFISVDSRPLLRVYYSQPPTLLFPPAISLLCLHGSCPQSQERSKSFTGCQKATEQAAREGKRRAPETNTAADTPSVCQRFLRRSFTSLKLAKLPA